MPADGEKVILRILTELTSVYPRGVKDVATRGGMLALAIYGIFVIDHEYAVEQYRVWEVTQVDDSREPYGASAAVKPSGP